ncbi:MULTISPECIES: glutathione S-transferase family protein [unclassified Iodidimonas]|uniref:glutathione S-transferase family protein n=1 Tax=unclassified Iodidimonas TaxID=2626145 RepID=UPI0024830335|nr:MULTISPECIES: glutathione S-transferase family protein [unclassified Iodidimonas]
MADLTLVIGNKNYSSWSLRPWLAMKANGLDFDEKLIVLDTEYFKDELARFGGAGRVPLLVDGDLVIWDSLAICDHLAERFPKGRHWWPRAEFLRAHARSAVAEMHSGFPAVRSEMPMNLKRPPKAVALSDQAQKEVARISTLWRDALTLSGGPFLYGDFSIADAFFAPVATRLRSYDVTVEPLVASYINHIHDWPDFQLWHKDAVQEIWVHKSDQL